MTMKRILLLFLLFCGGYVHAQELDSVRIYYRQGHREVDVLFRDNRAELERFIRILREEYGAMTTNVPQRFQVGSPRILRVECG